MYGLEARWHTLVFDGAIAREEWAQPAVGKARRAFKPTRELAWLAAVLSPQVLVCP